ncbi:MAG: hypothetical protein V2A78_01855 [bacterium]
MKPIDAYRDTIDRAKTFLLYYDGLANIRERRIRKDWKSSFLKFMHWPATNSIERIDGKDAIIILKNKASLTPNHFSSAFLEDMLRAALAFGMSALDRYIHERVIKGIIKALKSGSLTKQQEEFSIPVKTAIQISEEALRAHKTGKNIRTANIVRKKVQELLHKRPFQNWREIEYAFNLLGVTNLSGELQTAYRIPNIKLKKDKLNQIANRRNSIVHEGDLEKHERGGAAKMLPITKKYVKDSLEFLDELVSNLEKVVEVAPKK